jgi:hypothetical protein
MNDKSEIALAREKQTFRYDVLREGVCGFLDEGWLIIAVLIALRHFQAENWIKASLLAAPCVGMLCTPISLSFASRFKLGAERLCAIYYVLSGLALFLAATVPSLHYYTIGIIVAAFILSQRLPLITYIYSQNYRPDRKGRLVSSAFITLYIVGIFYSETGGYILDLNFNYYRWILIAMGCAALIAAWSCTQMPHTPLHKTSPTNPWKTISVLWEDKLFSQLISAWGLFGMSMLMLQPFKVEYLANIDYGLNLSNTWITRINYIIPAITYILSVKIWGRLYDKLNFLSIRIIVNFIFLTGVMLYFQSSNPYIIAVGAGFLGLGLGGGKITFSLWVTELAPPDKISSYMSANLAIAGLRGMMAPYLGYYLVEHIGLNALCVCCGGFIIISSLMFYSTKKHPRMKRIVC